jgi:hypothetical protein
MPHQITRIPAILHRSNLLLFSDIQCKYNKIKNLIIARYSTARGETLWFPSCLYKKQIKRHVKLNNDFNPLPRIETSSIRVSWRKPGLHRASPFLRDFPSSFASLQRAACEQAAFLFLTEFISPFGDDWGLSCI